MKIAPIDIAHKSFTRKFMGFDPEEVSDFLQSIAQEWEVLIRERNQLKEVLREKDLALLEFKERDQILKDTITTAHKMGETIKGDAEREARIILNDANQKAEMVQRDARDNLRNLYQEINDLKRIKLQFETRLKSLVQSFVAILDQEDFSIETPSALSSKERPEASV